MSKQFIASKLNLDTHYSLLDQRDLVYLMNGDIEGIDNSAQGMFVQNALSNELCISFPAGFTFINAIQLNKFEYAAFFVNGGISKISLINTKNCTISDLVTSTCLGFHPDYPIRGVYKHLNKTNERVIYWIDGLNPNRYLNVDQAFNGNFPKVILNQDCNDCDIEYGNELDCNAIRINKAHQPPCLTASYKTQGTLATGTYQVAIAYSEDGMALTDFYFSDPIKAFSRKENISIEVEIECRGKAGPFDKFIVALITQTKEGSLIVYNYGEFNRGTNSIIFNSLSNATVLDTATVLTKRALYDVSEHIVSNSETLLLGKHQKIENVNYQPKANQIEVKWVERKVPSKYAHLFPTLMRDEVYDIAIEWIDDLGRSRGTFHIPGRPIGNDYSISFGNLTFKEGDEASSAYFHHIDTDKDPCNPVTPKIWQVENTATTTDIFNVECPDCITDIVVSKKGKMGYYECRDITYPNTPEWGELACMPVRRHRMPSSDLTHIHNEAECETILVDSTDIIYDDAGNPIPVPSTITDVQYKEADCINILGLEFPFIDLPDGVFPNSNWSYRILISSREGNKSVLHKGLVYNVMIEKVNYANDENPSESINLYPNYPYNDLKPDLYLSSKQTNDSYASQLNSNHFQPNTYYNTRFTYHSPDVSFRETQNEFGTELKFYTEQIGKIKGEFDECYRHPKVALGAPEPDVKTSWAYARQFNSAAHYSEFAQLDPTDWKGKSRRSINYSQWLLPIKQYINNNQRFNNEMRETSYYMELDSLNVPKPKNEDTSRFTLGNIGAYKYKVDFCDTVTIGDTAYPVQAVSYYTGVKFAQPNQYGQNEQIKYVPLESCFRVANENTLYDAQFFGGDVYITRHSMMRKMPMFRDWLYDLPYNTEYNYRDHRNVYYPVYWYDNLTEAEDAFRLSRFDDTGEYAKGHIYLWVTGNPYFWCESEFIGDYREFDSTPNSRFYPVHDYNEIARLDNVSLQQTFLYDFSVLNNSIERRALTGETLSDAEYLVTYSLKNDLQSGGDNWLKFLPLNYTLLPQIYGEFTAMHYVDQYSIMFAFENEILYSQEDYTLQSSQGNNIFLGQGDIFSRRLRKLSNEETGYSGCVDPLSFKNTRYGTFFFDRYRSTFFMWNGQLKELSGMTSWINRYTQDVNPGYKDSMITVFDNFTYNIYFTDKVNRWTLSYKPKVDGFISFHSFVPNFYLQMPNTFISTDSRAFWRHNKIGSYQTYYGLQYDFEVGFIHLEDLFSELKDLQIWVEFLKYNDYSNAIYNKDKFFDKIFVYNNQGSTGIVDLAVKNRNLASQITFQNTELFPPVGEVSNMSDSLYRFNKLENLHQDPSLPMIQFQENGMNYSVLNIVNKLPVDREKIKGRWFKVHLISKFNNDHKILLQLSLPNNEKMSQ